MRGLDVRQLDEKDLISTVMVVRFCKRGASNACLLRRCAPTRWRLEIGIWR